MKKQVSCSSAIRDVSQNNLLQIKELYIEEDSFDFDYLLVADTEFHSLTNQQKQQLSSSKFGITQLNNGKQILEGLNEFSLIVIPRECPLVNQIFEKQPNKSNNSPSFTSIVLSFIDSELQNLLQPNKQASNLIQTENQMKSLASQKHPFQVLNYNYENSNGFGKVYMHCINDSQKISIIKNRDVLDLNKYQNEFGKDLVETLYQAHNIQTKTKAVMVFHGSAFDTSLWVKLISNKSLENSSSEQQQQQLKSKLFTLLKGSSYFKVLCALKFISLMDLIKANSDNSDLELIIDQQAFNPMNYVSNKKILNTNRLRIDEKSSLVLLTNQHYAVTDIFITLLLLLRTKLFRWLLIKNKNDYECKHHWEVIMLNNNFMNKYLNTFNSIYRGMMTREVFQSRFLDSLILQNQMHQATLFESENSKAEEYMKVLASDWVDLVDIETHNWQYNESGINHLNFVQLISSLKAEQVQDAIENLISKTNQLNQTFVYDLSVKHGFKIGVSERIRVINKSLRWVLKYLKSFDTFIINLQEARIKFESSSLELLKNYKKQIKNNEQLL